MEPNIKFLIRKFKPITSGQRHKLWFVNRCGFNAGRIKKLSESIKTSSGRNSQGKITSPHRKSFSKRYKSFFFTEFFSGYLDNVLFYPISIGVDKFTRKKYYVWKSQTGLLFKGNWDINHRVKSVSNLSVFKIETNKIIKQGFNFRLGEKGSTAYFHKKGQGKYVKASGTFFTVLSKNHSDMTVKLPSGKSKKFPLANFYKLGPNPFSEKKQMKFGSAGLRFRVLGRRGQVRGVAKNPVDHPHGGGEGKKSGQKKSPQGWYNSLRKCKTR